MKEVLLVCDGCSLGNADYQAGESRAAAAAILEYKDTRKIYGEYLGNASNQQAEIVAACIGFEQLREPCQVTVISDSQYLIKTMLGQFRKKANHAFWTRLERAIKNHQAIWTWTRGHAGHDLQERCDAAANAIARAGRVDPQVLADILNEPSFTS
ncbi:MAG: RNase H family protein [Acidobacteriota bacterium]